MFWSLRFDYPELELKKYMNIYIDNFFLTLYDLFLKRTTQKKERLHEIKSVDRGVFFVLGRRMWQ